MPTHVNQLKPFARRIRRLANLSIVMILLLLPFVIHGAKQSVDGMRITPEQWVSASHPQRQLFESFRKEFEGNDVVYVAWEGCTVDDPRLSQLRNELLSQNKLLNTNGVIPFQSVMTGADAIDSMQKPPLRLSREESIARLKGFLVGPDGRTSCAIIVLTYEGNEHRRESIEHIKKISQTVSGIEPANLVFAGPPHDGVAIDDESIAGVNIFGALSILVAGLFCSVSLRSWKISGVILGIASLGQGIVLSGIYFAGITLDAILIVSPPLVFVLTVSAGIHFVNYFREQSNDLSTEDALRCALKEGLKPCWLATLTSAVGLCSLMVSDIGPISTFGIVSSMGLIVTIGLLMLCLPDALLKWPLSRDLNQHSSQAGWLSWVSNVVPGNSGAILASFLLVLLIALSGVQNIRTSVDATSLFDKDSKIIRDYRWVESHIGASVPVEVVVRFQKPDTISIAERVNLVKQVQSEVQSVPGIESAMSALTFLPESVDLPEGSSPIRRAIVNKRLHAACDDLIGLNYLAENEQDQAWRISGRVFATQGLSYHEIGEQVQQRVSSLINRANVSGLEVQYTGMMPLIENVQVTVLDDLFRSLVTAFALIGLTILIVLRDARVTLLVTALNTLPVLLIFGAMGLLSLPIDIGTMMTAGIAMGIAVDDTIHFLHAYRRKLQSGVSCETSVRQTITSCGTAMLQTTTICASGMLVFAFSEFVPTRQFGIMMAFILGTAVICDLICLPALLVLISRKWSLKAFQQDTTHESLLPAGNQLPTS